MILIRISIITSILLSGCVVMPGMQNLKTAHLKKTVVAEKITVKPEFIPITPAVIAGQKRKLYYYRIAPADVLNINVWQHPQFDFIEKSYAFVNNAAITQDVAAGRAGYLVNSNGKIYFPLIGYIHVAGKTMETVRTDITERLKKYIKNPHINVRVSDYRGQKFYVLGEVEKPGFLPITDRQINIADALALSGSMRQDTSYPRNIYIIRGTYTRPQIFWLDARTPDKMLLAEGFNLQPKDILYVSSAPAARWNRVVAQILPTLQAMWLIKGITDNNQIPYD